MDVVVGRGEMERIGRGGGGVRRWGGRCLCTTPGGDSSCVVASVVEAEGRGEVGAAVSAAPCATPAALPACSAAPGRKCAGGTVADPLQLCTPRRMKGSLHVVHSVAPPKPASHSAETYARQPWCPRKCRRMAPSWHSTLGVTGHRGLGHRICGATLPPADWRMWAAFLRGTVRHQKSCSDIAPAPQFLPSPASREAGR